MSEEFVSSNIENNAETPDIEDKDYFQLIKRLKVP